MARQAQLASLGATVTVSASVQPGQEYYFKVLAASGPGPIGGYGLQVNFGSQPQAPIPPPNTVVAAATGSSRVAHPTTMRPARPASGLSDESWSLLDVIGTLTGWVETMSIAPDVVGSVAAGLLIKQAAR